MTHNCLICNKIADRKVTTSFNQGDLYLCSSKKCKIELTNRLTEDIKPDLSINQGRSPEKYESRSKIIIWSIIVMMTVLMTYGFYKMVIDY